MATPEHPYIPELIISSVVMLSTLFTAVWQVGRARKRDLDLKVNESDFDKYKSEISDKFLQQDRRFDDKLKERDKINKIILEDLKYIRGRVDSITDSKRIKKGG